VYRRGPPPQYHTSCPAGTRAPRRAGDEELIRHRGSRLAAAAAPGFARRRVFDARLGLTLLHHGVTEFATANVKDFAGLGFQRVFSPLE